MNQNVQDWEPVILRGKNPSAGPGAGGTQRQIVERKSSEGARLAKVEKEDYVKSKSLASESRKDLIAARVALKKSQVELDRQCAFPPNTLREIEAGRLTPTGAILNRLNRELKISLRLE
jgi:ribosome-binding protein aMBF1 (putative translation factor)